MRKLSPHIFFALLVSIVWAACQHDIINPNSNVSKDTVVVVLPPTNGGATGTGTGTCDTTSFLYNSTIQTILSTSCSGCHGTAPGSANIYLGDYASAKAYVLANTTTFLNAINYSTAIAASKRMPPAGKLASCQITQVQKWITNAYPQGVATGTGGTTPAPVVSDTVCFNSEVLPLYVSYCASAGCHSVASHRESVITTDYGYIMNGIRAKNPNSSKYYTIIGNGMPPRSSPQMTATNTATILKWINQGALNTACTNTCDTTKFGYANAVQTIIADNCGGCHGTSPGSANVYLGTYASAKAYISANTTLFNNAISHAASLTAAQRMPPAAKMIDCKIVQIQKWIANGYPQ